MTLENENNPVSGNETPEKPKNKGGRPKGSKDKTSRLKGGRPKDSGIALKQQRKHGIGLAEHIRERLHPELIEKYYLIILSGQTPVYIQEKGVDYIIPDPNPLLPAPTLEQRNAAMKALVERGYGLPAQQIMVDAEFRNKVELQLTGISQQQLETMNLQNLMAIREMFKLPAPSDEQESIDAEFTEITTNSPSTE